MPKIVDYLALTRPRQWPKNLLLFAALIFSGRFIQLFDILRASFAFAVFLALSSAIYAFNDAQDYFDDRSHPLKQKRPVASNRIGRWQAYAFSGCLAGSGLALAALLGLPFFLACGGYLLLQALYSLGLKHQGILDVFVISAGFVLRAAAGGLAIGVRISPWLLSCTTLLALFLALSKRRAEIMLLETRSTSHRRSLSEYSPALLDQMISVVASATVVSYMLYASFAPGGGVAMMFTVPFVLYGIFRYLYLSHLKGLAGMPEQVLLSDWPTQFNLLLWILTAVLVLLLGR